MVASRAAAIAWAAWAACFCTSLVAAVATLPLTTSMLRPLFTTDAARFKHEEEFHIPESMGVQLSFQIADGLLFRLCCWVEHWVEFFLVSLMQRGQIQEHSMNLGGEKHSPLNADRNWERGLQENQSGVHTQSKQVLQLLNTWKEACCCSFHTPHIYTQRVCLSLCLLPHPVTPRDNHQGNNKQDSKESSTLVISGAAFSLKLTCILPTLKTPSKYY